MKINDGISQLERRNHLFADDYFPIMEFTFHDLIGFIRDFSKNLKYFNLNNEADGTWEQLLITDEIVVISDIINFNINTIENDFIAEIGGDENTSNNFTLGQITPIIRLAEQIDFWYVNFKNANQDTHSSLGNELEVLIPNLLAHKLHLCQTLIHSLTSSEQVFKTKEFHPIWTERVSSANLIVEDGTNRKVFLKKTFFTFKNAIDFLKQKSASYFEQSLKSQQHSPHMALLIAFGKLYLQTINKFNGFSEKYFDFYYDEVLKIKAKSYSPDSTYLHFQLKEGVSNFLVKKETLFFAGKDELKKRMFYSADNDLVINKAKIAKLYTLYCDQNELIWPQSNCSNILIDEIPINDKLEFNSGNSNSKPLLGASNSINSDNANIGFAISDQCLLLGEGSREIDIDICFSEITYLNFNQQLEYLFEGKKLTDTFLNLFSKMFKVYVSIENAWLEIQEYSIDGYLINSQCEKNTLNIQFKLASDAPSITPCTKTIHGEAFMEGIPAIKIVLNSESYYYPYNVLKDLEIVQIEILAEVSDLKNILIANELGQIDTAKPFYPFGVIPSLNSYFILGAYEMMKKNVTNLSMQITWNNLPQEQEGLQAYFRTYEVDIKKSDYKCAISFLNNGKWLPLEKNLQRKVSLFSDERSEKNENKEKLSRTSLFKDIDTTLYKQNLNADNVDNYQYNNYTTGGFVKFSLCSPAFAFGHKDYVETLSKISINNTTKKTKKSLPNSPISPLVESISVSYQSKSIINFSILQTDKGDVQKQFYYLYPWGYEEILGKTKFDQIKLIPSIGDKGNLFIGLENAMANSTVSILFNLLNDSKLEIEGKHPILKWQYLASNEWVAFSKTGIVSDTTNGFLNSGIITINIPEGINKQNTILSDKLHWIKVSASENLDSICSVISISAQALRLTWQNQDNAPTHFDNALPAFTISKAKDGLSGIQKISQPLASFNGFASENKDKTRLRISERLKHKNRAVTAWDYERIILQNFPEIYKVKCIPHSNSESGNKPGHLLIIVLGNTESTTQSIDYDPMIGTKTLHEIKDVMRGLNSKFANIEVRNPVYERVQVRCAVQLKRGLDAGYFLDLLNKELIDFLTPWHSKSLNKPGFGKVIKCTDVLSFIQSLEYVEFVTDFSILQITFDSKKKYYLLDTAVKGQGKRHRLNELINDDDRQQNVLTPSYPWAILMSLEQHEIELIYDNSDIRPERTGIDELLIDSTFIIEE